VRILQRNLRFVIVSIGTLVVTVMLIHMLINISTIVVIVALIVIVGVVHIIVAILMMAVAVIVMTSVRVTRHYFVSSSQVSGTGQKVNVPKG
jgi:hypothetical protein